jgi:hypothetical protein
METFARRLQQTPVEAESSRPDIRVRARRIGVGEQVFMDLSPNEEPTKWLRGALALMTRRKLLHQIPRSGRIAIRQAHFVTVAQAKSMRWRK